VSSRRKNFVGEYIAGRASIHDFEESVERWHLGKSNLPLHQFLGFTRQEYGWIVEKPELLSVILFARKSGTPVKEVLTFSIDQINLARSKPASGAPRLLKWLESVRPSRRRASAG
jgi:hypothetical protein